MSAKGQNKMNKNVFSYDEDVIRKEIKKLFYSERFLKLLGNTYFTVYKFDAHDVDNFTIVKEMIVLN